ncbi:MAG: cytochrome b/b6 domain-containing protein [Candidatus Kapabacteria bacterium]|nr:cytochrome b/b6 domain-containing protein [Ignavibacteriota bacterium]MCW5884242.1 cytochrome b/b6 domain-containing protein [Candidatus Kapabacteria bacterium]
MKYIRINHAIIFVLAVFVIYSTFSMISSVSSKQVEMPEENEDCMMCHDDKDLKGQIKGKSVSVYVNSVHLLNSVHAEAKCIDCHTDLDGVETPHEDDLKPATCGKCHQKEQKDFDISMHGVSGKRGDPLTPTCKICHGSHQIVPVKSEKSPVAPLKIPFLCGKCHQEGSPVQLMRNIPQSHILENYTESIHGEGLFKKGLTVTATCVSCHSAHLILPHTDKRSSIARSNIAKTCTQCHARIEEVHDKIIDGQLWEKEEHVLPACVDCHQPHKARKAFYDVGLAKKECLNCHQKKDIKASSDGRSLYVDISKLDHSVHNELACSKCHIEVRPSKIRSCETITTKVNCGSCHDKVQNNFMTSSHGKFNLTGDGDAPSCITCHGEHEILPKHNPNSKIFTTNIPKLCSQCHQDGHKAALRLKENGIDNIINNYTESVHGQGLTISGLLVTANCSDCHSAHLESNHQNPVSSTHKDNISQTCGKCHWGISEKFGKSIHSPNISKSNDPLPACNDCHVAHSVTDPTKDEFRFSIMETCGKCHEKISSAYFDTYHGKASMLGSARSAKCHDCHSSHSILPINHSESSLSRVNIVQTCSSCHPNANIGFTKYLTHATHHDPDKYPMLYITFWGMTLLLLGTFVVSWFHTLLWLPKSLKMRKEIRALKAAGGMAHSGKRVMRFNTLSRILHVIMILSFLTLASTGMMLKFSYSGWAQFSVKLIGGVEIAGFLHRFAAILLFGVFFTHIYDLIVNKRKEYGSLKKMLLGPDTMLPTKKDYHDFIGSMKWFIGKGPRPEYGRWTYWEKFDYFAVFWGIFVIGSTGMMLWFPNIFTKFFSGEFINVATIIHSDEALLAAGFIFTIHFFNTHFRPEKFPMDTVIFSGSYELEEFKFDRPDEYRRLEEEGQLDKLFVNPPDRTLNKVIKFFGWSALITGLVIVFLIIVSILGAYF